MAKIDLISLSILLSSGMMTFCKPGSTAALVYGKVVYEYPVLFVPVYSQKQHGVCTVVRTIRPELSTLDYEAHSAATGF